MTPELAERIRPSPEFLLVHGISVPMLMFQPGGVSPPSGLAATVQ